MRNCDCVRSILGLMAALGLAGCGSTTSPNPSPTPTPTPVPNPSPTPSPTPTPSPFGQCVPSPPPLAKYAIKIHDDNGFKKVLDARPMVGPDASYCASVGLGGAYCSAAPEGDPRAIPCDVLVSGYAGDTGRPGPTWTWSDSPTGLPPFRACFPIGAREGGTPGCENHPDNQFLVIVRGTGSVLACSATGVCGGVLCELPLAANAVVLAVERPRSASAALPKWRRSPLQERGERRLQASSQIIVGDVRTDLTRARRAILTCPAEDLDKA